jgi:hypothetical protein
MKKQLIFFFIAVELGIMTVAAIKYVYPKVSESKNISTNLSGKYDPVNPPSRSLVGEVISQSGEINWQSREATETSRIQKLTQVKQGEKIITGSTGTLTINFQDNTTVTAAKNSEISLIQTLPQNLVFNQSQGTAIYTSESAVLSVRALHLLVDLTKSKSTITVDPETNSVIVKTLSGTAKGGYNDTDLNSQTFTLEAEQELIFNDDTRKVIIKKI